MRSLVLCCLCFVFSCQSAGTRLAVPEEIPENNPWEGLHEKEIYLKATDYLRENKPQHAADGLSILIKQHPSYYKNLDALLMLGKIYADQFHEWDRALIYYTTAIQKYPDSLLTAQAYFMTGFIHSNFYQQYDSAKTYYTQFLSKYPDHELAPSVRFELDTMGKDGELLIPQQSDSLKN